MIWETPSNSFVPKNVANLRHHNGLKERPIEPVRKDTENIQFHPAKLMSLIVSQLPP